MGSPLTGFKRGDFTFSLMYARTNSCTKGGVTLECLCKEIVYNLQHHPHTPPPVPTPTTQPATQAYTQTHTHQPAKSYNMNLTISFCVTARHFIWYVIYMGHWLPRKGCQQPTSAFMGKIQIYSLPTTKNHVKVKDPICMIIVITNYVTPLRTKRPVFYRVFRTFLLDRSNERGFNNSNY